jgi:predicted glycosyl hydrolase (DUF1957 family)
MVTAGTMGAYGERRVRTHLTRFQALLNQFETAAVDQPFLAMLETDDNIFGSIDYQDFTEVSAASGCP